MQVILNGSPADINEGSTIAELLEQLRIGRERVAVEVNLEIIPKLDYESHVLAPKDKIEIVHFVGGG